jgi:hypothetical protein
MKIFTGKTVDLQKHKVKMQMPTRNMQMQTGKMQEQKCRISGFPDNWIVRFTGCKLSINESTSEKSIKFFLNLLFDRKERKELTLKELQAQYGQKKRPVQPVVQSRYTGKPNRDYFFECK